MPTFETTQRFDRDLRKLTRDQRHQFRNVIAAEFIPGLKAQQFPPRLRVKRVRSTAKVWQMSWAPDGRATFQYGAEQQPGEAHVIWRRIGTHDVFSRP
jgi:mRNA-degrading endonuclease YafQ of YafQ-DinJ toxin-antitoxin module